MGQISVRCNVAVAHGAAKHTEHTGVRKREPSADIYGTTTTQGRLLFALCAVCFDRFFVTERDRVVSVRIK